MSSLKKNELQSILAEVEAEMTALLTPESAPLAKAGEDEPEESEASAPAADAAGGGAEESAGPAEGVSAAPEASDMSAAQPPEASAEASAPEAAPEAPADPAAEAGPVDPEALKAEYSKLAPEELKAHYMAAKAALFESMSAAGGAPGADAGAPPAPDMGAGAPPAPGPEASAPPPEAALKAELKSIPHNGGKIAKSEAELKLEALEAQIANLSSALEKVVSQPVRKALTSLNHVPKNVAEAPEAKAPSKEQIKEKVKAAYTSGKLSKSEKEKLLSYTLGNVSFEDVKDILK